MDSSDPTQLRLGEKLEKGAQQLSVNLSDQQSALNVQLLQLIAKWNRVHNLTAVRSIDDMVGRHILDSLAVLKWMPPIDSSASSSSSGAYTTDVLDVGTGAGLPVLPLAIMRPDLNFLSVESSGKKTRFQQQAIMELGLQNVRVKNARIEDVNESANVVISRAFTAPAKFLQVVEKNCVSASQVIIMLGAKELLPESLPGGFSLLELQEIDVPHVPSVRHVAVCEYS